jgi:uroporphyrinogen decarboxylase
VSEAFRKQVGNPDRLPIQVDVCRQHTETSGKIPAIIPDYSLSYYEDLTCRIPANKIRVKMGSY